MEVSRLPLNALRAFEASARLGSFTRAGLELRVTQTAIGHQVKALEVTLLILMSIETAYTKTVKTTLWQ